MKQIEVTILGQSYVLGAPDGGENTLLAAVKQVDREMTAIRNAGKVKARERIAVLAALNLAYALAQRDADADAPTAAASSGAATAPSTDTETETETASSHLVDAWIRRIDMALDDDGRLL